ncbi:hypothetical protein [Methanobacterium sp. BAmetb5]|uniref:hypothetical protein n=1 Tax=Methanobacterium sp. BAmetb5 TaxID=2025351 RepID=UPI000E96F5CD|nr:hypothetical protein [Methanobacterium sp. BAmetb5]AXV38805.1 MAG: hypothetical protein CIT02_00025 [Methanobacterium sp. BAmetb5]
MEKRHQEYLEYYQARLKKYEHNPLYPHSQESQEALYQAIASSKSLEEWGQKVENQQLTLKSAIALVKDKETARKKFYQDLNEQIRLHAPVKILEIVDSVKTEAELINTVNKIEGEVNIEITLDLFTQAIIDDLMMLEEIEVHQTAEVPEEWKKEINHDYPQELIDQGLKDWVGMVEPNARQWDPQWKFNLDLIWEERYRRLIPFQDEVLKKRVEQFKTYRGL